MPLPGGGWPRTKSVFDVMMVVWASPQHHTDCDTVQERLRQGRLVRCGGQTLSGGEHGGALHRQGLERHGKQIRPRYRSSTGSMVHADPNLTREIQ